MAKVKFSALVAEMRNKLNGSVFSKNRYGNYLRNKVTPVNPNTPAQVLARTRMANFSQAWRSLTEAQRVAWDGAVQDFARTDIFGDKKVLSGQALYNALSINIEKVGGTPADLPPPPTSLMDVTGVTLLATVSTGTSAFTLTATTTESTPLASEQLYISATAGVSAGKKYLKNLFRFISFTAPGASPYDLSTTYTAVHGTPSVGSRIGVRIQVVDAATGIAGVPIEATVLVTSVA